MAKNLLIVESPAKAKTIEGILGKDFEVKSCFGHIRDLEKNDMGIDVKNNFTPKYIVPAEKERVVKDLRALAKKADEVWLASDEDREGESISWHLAEVLNLDPKTTKRIVFHEITKPAIQKAVQNPRIINMDLVNAQQARRVVDRLVGFELSPVLWRKIGRQGGLSAGRVQSVAVKLIVEKEREINAFTPAASFKVEASLEATDLNNRTVPFKAEGSRFNQLTDAEKFLQSCIGAKYTVRDIQVRPGKRTPAAPFTTSTLQQEASRKLGYGVSKTMLLAQRLYESGKITYMRTDSVSLSDTAMDAIKSEINKNYGAKYLQVRKYKNKNESAQEAHEAIRPTYMENPTVNDAELNRLYELIWKRTIASQMSDAEFEKTTAKINISTNNEDLTASGEVLKFDGFLKVYLESTDEEETDEEGSESRLPNLTVGQALAFNQMTATERFTKHSARYTEASLVKKLEELGIGRPSTYAPTISTIIKRNYVEKKDKEGIKREYRVLKLKDDNIQKFTEVENTGAEKSKLFPTDLGLVVTDFLSLHFKDVMDYSFTANIEKEFDEIADGKIKWNTMVSEFYIPFHSGVEHTLETAERAVGERVLGVSEDGKPITARMGRYGPMVQIGAQTDEEKPKFAKLKASQSIETITMEEAKELFKLPLTLGEHEGQEVSVNIGRFGPYVKWGEQFVSLPKGEEPTEVDLARAIAIINAKQVEDAPIGFYDEKPITKGKGRFGPFIKWNDLFINIPRAYNFDLLTQKDCNELIEKKIEKEATRFIRQWPEEKIAIENGRWGAFIRFGKKMLKLTAGPNGKYTPEELATIELEEVKKMIVTQDPKAFDKKTKGTPKKKAATKKAPAKKAPPKKK
jgi:DNA topoisomerase-1